MTRRRKTLLACAAMVALAGGWWFFPSYILLPDLLDYCLFKIGRATYGLGNPFHAEEKIGRRGSFRFITWLLSSHDLTAVRFAGRAAVMACFDNPGNVAESKELFRFIAVSTIENHRNFRFPEIYSRDDYDALESRGLVIFYLFFCSKKIKLSNEENRFLSFIKENRLTVREKEYIALGEKRQWPKINPWNSSLIKDMQSRPMFE